MGKGGGGKKGGGGGGQEIITYVYYSSFAVAFCEGPVDDIVRIWADSELIYDKTGRDSVTVGVNASMEFFYGDEDQLPSTVIEAAEGAGNVPAHRGLCYVVFNDLELTEFGNRLPDITAEVTRNAKRMVYFRQTNVGFNSFRGRFAEAVRRRVYGVDTTNGPELVVHNIDTHEELLRVPNFRVPGKISGFKAPFIVGACEFGYVYASVIDVYSAFPVYKFDGSTGQLVGQSDLIRMPWLVIPFYPMDRAMLFVQQGTGATAGGDWALIDTKDMLVVEDQNSTFSTHPNPDEYCIIPGGPFEVERQNFTAKVATALFIAERNEALGGHDRIQVVRMDVKTEFKATSGGEIKQEYKGYELVTVIDITPADLLAVFPTMPQDGSVTFNVNSMLFDWADYTLLLDVGVNGFSNIKIKVNQASQIVWGSTELGWPVRMGMQREPYSYINGTYSYIDGSDRLHVVNTLSGTKRTFARNAPDGYTAEPLPGDTVGAAMPTFTADLYDGRTNSVYDFTQEVFSTIYMDRVSTEPVALPGVLQDVAERVGLSPVDIDTSLVENEAVRGYVVRRSTTARSVLEQLAGVYLFDVVETDGQLRFVTRGQTPVVTIPQRDLAPPSNANESSSGGDYWKTTRLQEVELPSQVGIKFVDFEADYHTGYQLDKRQVEPNPTMQSSQQNNIEVPIVLTPTEARQMAARVLYSTWVERDLYETRVGTKYLRLDPTDVIEVALDDGTTYTARIARMDIGADYSVNLSLVSEDIAAYSSALTGGTNLGYKPQELTLVDPGELYLLDLPLINDGDDDGTRSMPLYWAGSGVADSWTGGILFEIDQDIGVPVAVGLTKFDTPVGFITDSLPAWDRPFSPDTENTITIVMNDRYARFQTISDFDLLAGGNMVAIGNEIVQFRDVEVQPDGSMVCSYLLRGRRGTDWVTRQGNGSRLVISLAVTPLRFYRTVEGATGNFTYTLFTRNSRDTLPPVPKEWNKRPLMPWSPVQFRRSFDGTDLTLTWIRRTRHNGGWLDATGVVPLNEESEEYEVYILAAPYDPDAFDAADPATYVRAFTGLAAPTLTYTSADMAADGFDPNLDPLYLVGFQISAAVGRGFAGPHTVHA